MALTSSNTLGARFAPRRNMSEQREEDKLAVFLKLCKVHDFRIIINSKHAFKTLTSHLDWYNHLNQEKFIGI